MVILGTGVTPAKTPCPLLRRNTYVRLLSSKSEHNRSSNRLAEFRSKTSSFLESRRPRCPQNVESDLCGARYTL